MKVKYEAAPKHTLIVGDVEIAGGQTAEVPDADGKRLLADPNVSVTEIPATEPKQPKPTAAGAGQTKKEK